MEKSHLKIGDRVRRNSIPSRAGVTSISKEGWTGTIVQLNPTKISYGIKWDNGEETDSTGWECIDLIPKKTIMKKLTNYIKKAVDANTQELLKAGFINGDLMPTYEGEQAIKEILWFANYEALVAKAKEINAEAEAQAKK